MKNIQYSMCSRADNYSGKSFLLSIIVLLLLLVSAKTSVSQFSPIRATYLGSSEKDDVIDFARVASDGTFVLGLKSNRATFGSVTTTYLGSAPAGSRGTIIRMSTDGSTILSVTKTPEIIVDLALDGNDNIYVAYGAAGMVKLNRTADTVRYSVTNLDIHRLDAGASEMCAMLGGTGIDFNGRHVVRLYDRYGNLRFEHRNELRYEDIAINEKESTVLVSGFNIDFSVGNEYHLAFYQGLDFDGVEKYLGYNWKMEEWFGRNPWEQVRPRLCGVTKLGDFILQNSWTGRFNNVLNYDPFNRSVPRSIVGGDAYHSQLQFGEEGDTKKKTAFVQIDKTTGAFVRMQAFAVRSMAGPNTTALEKPGALDTDLSGRLYLSGNASTNAPYTFNPKGLSTGGTVLLVMSPNFATRVMVAGYGLGDMPAVGVRDLNGVPVVINGGTLKTGGYTLNPLESFTGGTQDAYYVVINAPGTKPLPSAPSGLTNTLITGKKIVLKWNANVTNEDGFIIERKIGSGSFERYATLYADDTSFIDQQISPSAQYTYRIKSFNYTGSSAYSPELMVTAVQPNKPAAPAAPVVTPLSTVSASITWQSVTGAQGYLVLRALKNDTNYSVVHQAGATTNSFIDPSMPQGLAFQYKIQAFNQDGSSPFSPATEVALPSPTLLPAQNPTNLTQGLCKQLYYFTSNLSYWPSFNMLPLHSIGAVNYPDPKTQSDTLDNNFGIKYSGYINVPADGNYRFTLGIEKMGALFIDDKLVVDNTTWKWGPWKEQGIVALQQGYHKFDLQFNFTYSEVYDPYLTLSVIGGGINGDSLPASWLFRPQTCGNPACTVPAKPDITSIDILSGTSVKVNIANTAKGQTYILERNTYDWSTYDPFKPIANVDGDDDTISFINNHLSTGMRYLYRIKAYNTCGFSPYSDVDSVFPNGTVSNKPTAPNQLMSSNSGNFVLTWNDNSFNESKFYIEFKPVGGTYSVIDSTQANINNLMVLFPPSGTLNGCFRVRAYNSSGYSSYSNEICVNVTGTAYSFDNSVQPLNIFPNPTSGLIYISGRKIDEPIEVFDLSGKRLILQNTNENVIDINHLKSGIYLIRVGNSVSKIIKD